MKKRMIIAVLMALGIAGMSWASSFRPLTEQERSALGATHVATITHADLTTTDTNTAQTLTTVMEVKSGTAVQLVAMQLITAFDIATDNTNYTGSLVWEVGAGTDPDLYLTSTELASEGTEVWLKYGRSVQAAATTVITNVIGTTTNLITVATGLTDDSTGRKVYTADDTIDFKFTPNAQNAVSECSAGEVRIYFRQMKK